MTHGRADFVPRSPIDAHGATPFCASHFGQRIDKRVRRCMVGLTSGPKESGDGRKADEEIQRVITRGLMQIPGADHLRREDSCHAFGIELQHRAIVEQARRLNHTANRRHVTSTLKHRTKCRRVGDVCCFDIDTHVARVETRYGGVRLVCRAGTRREHQMRYTAIGQPLRGEQSDSRRSANHDVRRARDDGNAACTIGVERFAMRDDDLARVAALRHEAERIVHARQREDLRRQR